MVGAICAFQGFIMAVIAASYVKEKISRSNLISAFFWGTLSFVFMFDRMVSSFILGLCFFIIIVLLPFLPKQSPSEPFEKSALRASKGFIGFLPMFFYALFLIFFLHFIPWVFYLLGLHAKASEFTQISIFSSSILTFLLYYLLFNFKLKSFLVVFKVVMEKIIPALIIPYILATLGLTLHTISNELANTFSAFLNSQSTTSVIISYMILNLALAMLTGNAFTSFPIIFTVFSSLVLTMFTNISFIKFTVCGMLMGYCGTLLSPVASNFNLFPLVLNGYFQRKYSIIFAQLPTVLASLLFVYLYMLT